MHIDAEQRNTAPGVKAPLIWFSMLFVSGTVGQAEIQGFKHAYEEPSPHKFNFSGY